MEIYEFVLNYNIFEFILEYVFILEYFAYRIIYVINQSYFLIYVLYKIKINCFIKQLFLRCCRTNFWKKLEKSISIAFLYSEMLMYENSPIAELCFCDFAEFPIWLPTMKTAAENSHDTARNNITSCYKV